MGTTDLRLCAHMASTQTGVEHMQFAEHTVSRHADIRAGQRGVSQQRLEALLYLADLEVPVGRNISARRLSRDALSSALAEGWPPATAGRLQRMFLVEADDGTVVTVGHLYGRRSRAYRRRIYKHWKGNA